MKLVDKMILLTRMIQDNEDYKLDVISDIQKQHSFHDDQKKYVKDKSLYEQSQSILEEMERLHHEYNAVNKKLKHRILSLLRTEEVAILRRDYDTFARTEPDLGLMVERSTALSDEFLKLIKRDIGYYSDWRWAGVELNPSNGILTNSILACDPLYIYRGNVVDTDNVKNQFNRFFAEKRLMFCDHFHHLPQQQLGLAVSVNCYEFWPLDPIKQEMQNVYNALRPGGHYIFTYNDCEKMAGLDFCTNDYRAYNTQTLMSNMVYGLGFDIVKEQCYRDAQTWMVVKKPGELTSQKLTAPLVTIETPLKSI
jgi:SAM-dependent methyltransferase